jgi:tRNA dimethylallyltransferase
MAEALPDGLLDGLAGLDAVLIAGPTASGKSALALAVARAVGGVVVNGDSMQIYAGLRILTARPTLEEEALAEHLLYGFVDPQVAFSAGDYIRTVGPVLAGLKAAGKCAVVTGGTGLYFRALTEGLVETPEIPPHVMDEVKALGDGPKLHAWLQERDPGRAADLHPSDTPRLERAASLWLATGRSMKDWHDDQQRPILSRGSWRGVVLLPERQALYARIDARFHVMLASGALEEVQSVMALGLPSNRGVMKAHGMPHLIRHIRGELMRAEAIRLGQQDTRNYARRQGVWARRYMADWRVLQV